MVKVAVLLVVMLVPLATAQAKVQTQTVPYSHGKVKLVGHLAWDDAVKGKRPGVLVVHEWWGLNEYAKKRAEQLAAMGYVAFAVDMYGKGKVTEHPDQASAWMKETTANVKNWQDRAKAGLLILQNHDLVDADRIAAIGYCFGGATVTEMAYGGASLKGVVSFHGSLPLPEPNQVAGTKVKIFIAHGKADPFLTEDHLKKFRAAVNKAGFDWRMKVYPGARHSFTNPEAGKYGMDAIQYNKDADEQSWQDMQYFFDELFGKPKK